MSLGLAVSLQACGDGADDATSGRRVVLHTKVQVSDVANTTFETAVGWRVTLSSAAVSAGPFYYFDGTPPLVLRQRHDAWQYAARVLGLGTAHAHPGHYQAGNAMGEMLESSSVNLFDGVADFPDGTGITGTYRSARFTFAEASGPAKKQLDGHVAVATGVAEREGEPPRHFRAFADLSAIELSAFQGRVEGCELSEVDVKGDGTVTLTVNPKIWFDLVDFTEAEEASADAPADFPAGSQPQLTFVLGVTQLSAYKFSYSSP
ncbi:MAG TPA: hypothetical protein VHP33_40660 [Polyangiaceae bacterium]|nr:hypothetical protein [Polyangiaceae bacterium]